MNRRKAPSTPAAQIRRFNADAVYAAMRGTEVYTVSQLMTATGLSRPTVHAACRWLIAAGIVREVEPAVVDTTIGGRPALQFQARPDAGLVVALDIRENRVSCAVADLFGRILVEDTVMVAGDSSLQSQITETAPQLIRRLIDEQGACDDQVWQVCVSIPAPVHTSVYRYEDPRTYRFNVHQLTSLLADGLPWPMVIENDANLAMVAEQWVGAAQGASDAVLLDICENGFGAGLIINGELVRGRHGIAGEMTAVDYFADMGPTGGMLTKARLTAMDHVAAVSALPASGPDDALVRLTQGRPEAVTARMVFELAIAGDPVATQIVDHLGAILAKPTAMLVTLLDPELVVLYGLDQLTASALEASIVKHTNRLVLQDLDSVPPKLTVSQLGSRGSLLGAVRRATSEIEARLFSPPPGDADQEQ